MAFFFLVFLFLFMWPDVGYPVSYFYVILAIRVSDMFSN